MAEYSFESGRGDVLCQGSKRLMVNSTMGPGVELALCIQGQEWSA